jgi:hypothetical protein
VNLSELGLILLSAGVYFQKAFLAIATKRNATDH